ncbi:hypothetical protein [Microbulbifer sp. YPW1]|uniref:hypothetical protein n=1 Tax=Microbulbifer sp. YPW1 TaxID=2745199 RepID=UPI0015988797|nr:hypothetical protein [Microbulbifer sp. YPW1]QKX16902.1 hypothetical protein HUW35_07755 [Microbulbifer sp. YPW1]
MKNKFVLIAIFVAAGSGCASQEDMLHADLWSGDPDAYTSKSDEDIRDLGKTPREKMLEQRRQDEKRKNRSVKDNLIDGLVHTAIKSIDSPD